MITRHSRSQASPSSTTPIVSSSSIVQPKIVSTKWSIPVDRQGHPALPLEPALEHQIVLALVGPVLGDFGDEPMIVWTPRPNRLEHAVERGVAAMLVVQV